MLGGCDVVPGLTECGGHEFEVCSRIIDTEDLRHFAAVTGEVADAARFSGTGLCIRYAVTL